MSLYRFSPIKDQSELAEAIVYVIKNAEQLCEKVTGQKLPITYLTIFAHFNYEYEELVTILKQLGTKSEANNGVRTKLKHPIQAGDQAVQDIRIRKPDPYRMQVGCCDFGVADYIAFKKKYLDAKPENLRLIERPNYEMVEFFDPDFDVLAYIVS